MTGSAVRWAGVLAVVGGLAAPGALASESYGTTALTASVVAIVDCDTLSPTDAWQPVVGTANRFLTSGVFACGVSLPAGALVVRIDVEACDTSTTSQVTARFFRTTTAGGAHALVGTVGSGVAETLGCGLHALFLGTPEPVDNATRKYFFEVATGNTAATTVAAVRAHYRLRVSAAPAAATFADVPTTHPYFRFVEALVASGITGGCGAGGFCPDQPVARGQMAVWLATALGLHFAP
jgi:hypothetical protein